MELPDGLESFLKRLDDYSSTVPDEFVKYHLRRNGEDCDDPRLIRTVSVATQYFAANVLHDALQLAKRRRESSKKRPLDHAPEQKPLVLTTEDVAEVLLGEFGVNEKRAPYFTGKASAPPPAPSEP